MSRAEQQREYRRLPKRCACEEFMGTRRVSAGQWVCERCQRIERQNAEVAHQRALRRAGPKIYGEEYRMHCEVEA